MAATAISCTLGAGENGLATSVTAVVRSDQTPTLTDTAISAGLGCLTAGIIGGTIRARQPRAPSVASEFDGGIANVGSYVETSPALLADFPDGQGFSAVYDTHTEIFHARPSIDETLGIPEGHVARQGGHGSVNSSLDEGIGEQVDLRAGFTIFKRADGLEIQWESGGVNLDNFGNDYVPYDYRAEIIQAVELLLGQPVIAS